MQQPHRHEAPAAGTAEAEAEGEARGFEVGSEAAHGWGVVGGPGHAPLLAVVPAIAEYRWKHHVISQ